MANEIQTGLIAAGTGIFTSAATLAAVWLRARADKAVVETTGPAASMDAITRGFQGLVDHLTNEVDDLRNRIQIMEGEMRELRERNTFLEGEVRQHKQIEASRRRFAEEQQATS